MNERKLKQLNILVIATILLAIGSAILFATKFSPMNENKITGAQIRDLNSNWILRDYRGEADQLIDLPTKIDAEAGETLLIMHKVPDDVTETSVLLFETQFQNVVVTIGQEKIYSNGVLTNQTYMNNAVPCQNIISIGTAKPGDIISIYIASAYGKYSGNIGSIYYGTKGDAIANIIKENGVGFIIAVTLIIVTILLGISLVFMKNVNVDKRKSIYAFGFILLTALWCISDNPIVELFNGNVFGVYMTNIIILLLMPVVYIMHQRCFAVKRRFAKIFEIAMYVYAVNFLTGLVFQFMKVCDFATYETFTKVLITIGLILLSGIMYLAADTYSDKTIYSNLFANLVLTIACLAEAILSIFDFYLPYDGVALQTGVYIFLILLVVATQKSIIKEMNKEKEQAISHVEHERDDMVKNINTALIYSGMNIAVNALKDNDRENSRLVYDTSMYMKYNLMAINEKDLVPFSQELEYIKAFLGIQKRKNPDLEITVEDKVTDFLVPFNTIEPLVENAVLMGALKSDAGSRIVFRSYERLDCYAIQIVDNGKGIGPDKRFAGKQSFKSIRKRIKNGCKGAVEIKTKPDKGTIVTVKIPKEGFIIKE
ncbi:MAG: hypothetical protein IKJ73_09455 [Lachnospiraceae bacterium]|nr:hypothetical protein [Lachnospiraceae bacterium]